MVAKHLRGFIGISILLAGCYLGLILTPVRQSEEPGRTVPRNSRE